MTTLYLADDQKMLLSALASLLDLEDDFDVVGTASDGAQALSDILLKKPELAILDIEMPKLTGLEVAFQLREKSVPTKIIILTTFAQETYFQQAVASEVNGYLLKDSKSDLLIRTIHDVLDGQTIFAPELVRTVLRAEKNPLTAREMEVLLTIAKGLSTEEIARAVFLSEGTVRNYISSILSKTGSHNRIEAINTAKVNKWI